MATTDHRYRDAQQRAGRARAPSASEPGSARRALASLAIVAAIGSVAVPAAAQRYLVRTYTEHDGLPNSKVVDFAASPDGRLWILTRTGLAVFDGTHWSDEVVARSPRLAGFTDLAIDADGGVWVARTTGQPLLAFHDRRRWNLRRPPSHLKVSAPAGDLAVVVTPVGPMAAIGTAADGVLVFVRGFWRLLGRQSGLPGDRVHALLADGERIVVGTDRGLASLTASRIEPIDLGDPARSSQPIYALARAGGDDDRLWLLGGDWLGELGAGGFTLLASSLNVPDTATAVLAPDGDDGLCFGNEARLACWHAHTGRVEPLGRGTGIRGEGANALIRDWEGSLWIGNGLGLSQVVDRRFATWDASHGLLENEVTAVLPRRDGSLVYGHNRGLTLVRDGALRAIALAPPRLPEGELLRVLDLTEDAAGRLWAATSGGGLAVIENGREVRWPFTTDSRVNSVVIDGAGTIYVAMHTGLGRVAGGRIEPLEPRLPIRRLFVDGERLLAATPAHGLVVREGSEVRAFRGATPGFDNVFAVLSDLRGITWVGTESGLAVVEGGALVPPTELKVTRPVYFLLHDRDQRMWIGTDYGVYRYDGSEVRHFTVHSGLAGHETNRAAAALDAEGNVLIGTDQGVSRYQPSSDAPRVTSPRVALLELQTGKRVLDPAHPADLAPSENGLTFRIRALSFRDRDRIRYRTQLEGSEEAWAATEGGTELVLNYRSLPPGRFRLMVQAANREGPFGPVVRSGTFRIAAPVHLRPWFLATSAGALCGLVALLVSYAGKRRYAHRLEGDVHRRTVDLDRARGAAVAEKQRLAATLSSIIEGIVGVDAAGRVALINDAAQAMIGHAADACLGRPLGECLELRELDRDRPVNPDAVIRQRGEAVAFVSARLVRGDREPPLEVQLSGAPVRDRNGAPIGAVLALRDVTRQRQIEAELAKTQRLESLGLLAAGIAHDFNNLLTVLLGNLSLARTGLDDPRVDAYLADAESAVGRARTLSGQLLTFAAGGAPVTAPNSLADLVREAAEFVLRGSSIRLDLDLPDDLWPVEIDAQQIDQVLNNLLINARQAIRDVGMIAIRARNATIEGGAHATLAAGTYVYLEVTDDGVGIAAADLPKIFDPYWSSKSSGSGLGLASAFSIVHRHGGTLSCRSEPGAGATFEVILPASREVEAHAPPASAAMPEGAGRVLVMDDEPSICSLVRLVLEPLGYEVATVAHCAQAQDVQRKAIASGRPFDLVILDLTIPGGPGGVETLEALRAEQPDLLAIASSGYADDPVMADCQRFGFAAALSKPYRVAELAQMVAQVLPSPAARAR